LGVAWRILVHLKPEVTDHHGARVKKEWRAAGNPAVGKVRVGQAYEFTGDVSREGLEILARQLLTDPVTQESVMCPADRVAPPKGARLAEIWLKPGVADPVADTVALGARDLHVGGFSMVRSGQVYEFHGKTSEKAVLRFCEEHLMNPLIQQADIL
jgi:phosphoribosylformylglycinamidine (FGAM) synthase PurS component